MALTRRKIEFLKTIKQLYESSRLPVHYVQVAQFLGISKWSAYEMLKKLEKDGLVSSQYKVNQREKYPGRAMILFAPTHLLDKILSGKILDEPAREWRQIKERLLAMCEGLKKDHTIELEKQLLAELPGIGNPMFYSAYILTILVAQLHTLSDSSVRLIKKLAQESVNPESGLAMFTGAVVASVPKIASRVNPLPQLLSYIPGFQKNLALLNRSQQLQLMDFLGDALAKTG